MPTNNFLPFSPTDTGTNLLSQAQYIAATDRTNGNQPGVASSKLNNKALRQATFISSQYAQFLSDQLASDVLDDGNAAEVLAQINALYAKHIPVINRYTTGSGTWAKTYVFQIVSGSATVGATYTNNAATFTVKSTISSAVVLETTGSAAPAVSGTLTKATGSGDATITFYAVKSALYLRVTAVGAGGGGGPSGINGAGSLGSDGGQTTFGSSLLIAAGGSKGPLPSANGGAGGTVTVNSPATTIRSVVGQEGGGTQFSNTLGYQFGSMGGITPMGGGGPMTANGAAGRSAPANTGGGGAGGNCNNINVGYGGAGGGGGAYLEALISPPSATYSYVVGSGGAGGTNGSGFAGGNGSDGLIIVEEHFQ